MASSSAPFVKQFTNYTNSSAGLENLLRFVQSICQVVEAVSISPLAAQPWSIAWKNIALGRRYFRYFKFIDCFEHTWAIFPGRDNATSIAKQGGYVALTLEACMWSNLGCYLLLEALTILDAMGIWVTAWSNNTLAESYKFWFYSLAFSMLGSIWQVLSLAVGPKEKRSPITAAPSKLKYERKEDEPISLAPQDDVREPRSYSELMTDIAVSSCDILIPGSFLGWVDVGPLAVSSASVLSTVLIGKREWFAAQKGH